MNIETVRRGAVQLAIGIIMLILAPFGIVIHYPLPRLFYVPIYIYYLVVAALIAVGAINIGFGAAMKEAE